MQNHRLRRRQRGISLIEISTVLALAAIFIAGVFLYKRSLSTNQKAEEAVKEVVLMRNTVYELYSSQASFGSLNASELISSNVVPRRMVDSTGAGLRHSFKGRMEVQPTKFSSFGDSFYIELDDLPSDGCMLMAAKDFGRDVYRIDVTGGASGTFNKFLEPGEAANACGATGENAASITWFFR